MRKMIRFTTEQKKFILENYKGIGNKELTQQFNQKFNTNLDKQIYYFKRNNHLDSGLTGKFEKGHKSHNKGKKWDDYLTKEQQEKLRKTTFKRGHKSANAVEIGEEHMRYSGSKQNDPGYLYVKVCDGRGNKNWIPKQRVIYEQHYGHIPPNHKIIFADGNRFNFDIDNLICISSSEELIMNRHNLRFKNSELTKTGTIIAKVMDKTNKVRK